MAEDPKTREWWTMTDPMQEPLAIRPMGNGGQRLPEVFHVD